MFVFCSFQVGCIFGFWLDFVLFFFFGSIQLALDGHKQKTSALDVNDGKKRGKNKTLKPVIWIIPIHLHYFVLC